MAEHWCPDCEPGRDPLRDILEVRYCASHGPTDSGPDDRLTGVPQPLSSMGEADGADCRAVQALIQDRGML